MYVPGCQCKLVIMSTYGEQAFLLDWQITDTIGNAALHPNAATKQWLLFVCCLTHHTLCISFFLAITTTLNDKLHC